MDKRAVGAWSRRTIPLLAALSLLALALSGCLIDTTPKTPVPPTPTAIPRPTPTETPGILPIRQPTFPPTRPPQITTTAVPNTVPDIRASGQILYLVTQGERRDILTVGANGQERQRLVSGTYESPVWSPDGGRFAAYGATVSGGLSDQLAIFAGDGRALARYSLAGVGVGLPAWSPDGQSLLCLLRDPAETSGERTAWVAAAAGLARLTLPDGAIPWRWTPTNRVASIVYPPGGPTRVGQANPAVVWSTDPAGDQPRKEAEGTIIPLGWSPDGQTFYALDGLLLAQTDQPTTRATSVIAIDRRSGTTRTLIAATTLGSERSTPTTGTTSWFEGGTVASAGGELALWLRVVGPTAAGQLVVALVDESGRVLARDPLPPSTAPAGFAWSSGGILLAYIAIGPVSNDIHILNPGEQAPLVYPVSAEWSPGNPPPSWSPDSRWIVIVGPTGITIVATTGDARSVVVVGGVAISAPAWRPAALR